MVVIHFHIPLPVHHEPVGDGIVHHAEKHRDALSQTDFRLVVFIDDRRELERDDRLELVVHEARLPDLHAAVGNGFRPGHEADVPDFVHGLPVLDDGVGHTAGTRFQVHGEFPVRGEERGGLGRRQRGHGRQRGRQDAEEGFFHRFSKKLVDPFGPTNLMRITCLCKCSLTPVPGPPSRWRL